MKVNNTDQFECEFEPLVSAMIDDELSTDEAESVRVHLLKCASCQRTKSDFESIGKSVLLLSGNNDGRFEQVNGHASVVTRKQRGASDWLSVWRLAPAAIVAALLLGLFLVVLQSPSNANADQLSAEQFVEPISDLNRINQRQHCDQKLMLKTLCLDLRSLKLELVQLENANPQERQRMESQIESMLQRVRQFANDNE